MGPKQRIWDDICMREKADRQTQCGLITRGSAPQCEGAGHSPLFSRLWLHRQGFQNSRTSRAWDLSEQQALLGPPGSSQNVHLSKVL